MDDEAQSNDQEKGVIEEYRENMKRFGRTFEMATKQISPGWIERKNNQENLSSVSIGAGSAQEVEPITEILPNIQMYGVDVDVMAEGAARVKSRRFPNYRFVRADATNESIYKDFPAPDLIFFRSPDAVSTTKAEKWDAMIPLAWSKLNKDGVLYITTNDDPAVEGGTDTELIENILNEHEIPYEEIKNPEPLKGGASYPERKILVAYKK